MVDRRNISFHPKEFSISSQGPKFPQNCTIFSPNFLCNFSTFFTIFSANFSTIFSTIINNHSKSDFNCKISIRVASPIFCEYQIWHVPAAIVDHASQFLRKNKQLSFFAKMYLSNRSCNSKQLLHLQST